MRSLLIAAIMLAAIATLAVPWTGAAQEPTPEPTATCAPPLVTVTPDGQPTLEPVTATAAACKATRVAELLTGTAAALSATLTAWPTMTPIDPTTIPPTATDEPTPTTEPTPSATPAPTARPTRVRPTPTVRPSRTPTREATATPTPWPSWVPVLTDVPIPTAGPGSPAVYFPLVLRRR